MIGLIDERRLDRYEKCVSCGKLVANGKGIVVGEGRYEEIYCSKKCFESHRVFLSVLIYILLFVVGVLLGAALISFKFGV